MPNGVRTSFLRALIGASSVLVDTYIRAFYATTLLFRLLKK